MGRLKVYSLFSLLITISAIAHAISLKKQFYPATIFMTQNKINIVILGNLAFLILLLIGDTIRRIFLGKLSRDEIEELISNSKYAITETCLALTIFREELNLRVLMLFTLLLFIKIFHWLAALRVEAVARLGLMPRLDHIRLIFLLLFLSLVDTLFTGSILVHLLSKRQASVLLLFGFEYAILLVFVITTGFKYIIFVFDLKMDGRWQSKSAVLFYLEFTGDLIRLGLYLVFFMIICAYYGLPLHLIRELCVTFYHLRDRIIKFITYRRMTKNMNERFIDATPTELENSDRTCIVCREDMDSAKKLPCGHLFHFHCLRTWLERSQSCPTCRADITQTVNPPPLPPLPPHLQRHLDQIRPQNNNNNNNNDNNTNNTVDNTKNETTTSESSNTKASSLTETKVNDVPQFSTRTIPFLPPSNVVMNGQSSSSQSIPGPGPNPVAFAPPLSFEEFLSNIEREPMGLFPDFNKLSNNSVAQDPLRKFSPIPTIPPLPSLISPSLITDPSYIALHVASTRMYAEYIDALELQIKTAKNLFNHHVIMQAHILNLQNKLLNHSQVIVQPLSEPTSQPNIIPSHPNSLTAPDIPSNSKSETQETNNRVTVDEHESALSKDSESLPQDTKNEVHPGSESVNVTNPPTASASDNKDETE